MLVLARWKSDLWLRTVSFYSAQSKKIVWSCEWMKIKNYFSWTSGTCQRCNFYLWGSMGTWPKGVLTNNCRYDTSKPPSINRCRSSTSDYCVFWKAIVYQELSDKSYVNGLKNQLKMHLIWWCDWWSQFAFVSLCLHAKIKFCGSFHDNNSSSGYPGNKLEVE